MKAHLQLLFAIGALLFAGSIQAKNFRATDMTSQQWSEAMTSLDDTTIEFRKGDEIPVSLSYTGDFLATSQSAVSFVRVQRDFWFRFKKNKMFMSLDGVRYDKYNDVLTGSFQIGASSPQPGMPVNTLDMRIHSELK